MRSKYDNLIEATEQDNSIIESIQPALLKYTQQIRELENSITHLERKQLVEHPKIDTNTVIDIFAVLFKNLESTNKTSLKTFIT